MGTKNKPGSYDCYKNAEPDEPMFVLLGRDPTASFVVSFWVVLRQQLGEKDEAMLAEARACADAMAEWALAKGKGVKSFGAGMLAKGMVAGPLGPDTVDDVAHALEDVAARVSKFLRENAKANVERGLPAQGPARVRVLKAIGNLVGRASFIIDGVVGSTGGPTVDARSIALEEAALAVEAEADTYGEKTCPELAAIIRGLKGSAA